MRGEGLGTCKDRQKTVAANNTGSFDHTLRFRDEATLLSQVSSMLAEADTLKSPFTHPPRPSVLLFNFPFFGHLIKNSTIYFFFPGKDSYFISITKHLQFELNL